MVTTETDPRPRLSAALDQTQRQVDAIDGDDLSRATTCAEFDVRTLLAHLLAVLRKLDVVARGGEMTDIADPAEDDTSQWNDLIRRARDDMERAWAADTALQRHYTLPWGVMSGRDLLDAYIHEFTAHSWDLARITGRVRDLDPALAEAALDWYSRNVPAESRVEGGPFGPAIPVPDDADTYTKLAAYLGRTAG